MKNGICYIVCAGDNYGLDFKVREEDMVIAADAGYSYLEQAGIPADLVIGDFDSVDRRPEHPNMIVLPKEKDDTDTLAAMKEGIKAGYKEFCIYCGTGGRFDHTYANIQLLVYLSTHDMKGSLIDKSTIITAVTNGSIAVRSQTRQYVSVFAYGEKAEGVTLRGLKYELDNGVLTHDFPLGVSNELSEEQGEITVANGTLIVVYPRY